MTVFTMPIGDRKALRNQLRGMWENGLDTVDMARALQVPESIIERELHAALEVKRAIISSFGNEQ